MASEGGDDVVRVAGSTNNHSLEVMPSLPLGNLVWGVLGSSCQRRHEFLTRVTLEDKSNHVTPFSKPVLKTKLVILTG